MKLALLVGRGIALAAAVASGAAACGGSTTGGGGGGGLAGTSTEFGQSFCAYLEPCCAAAKLPTDGQQCQAFVSLAAQHGSYDPTAGSECLSAIKAASTQSNFCDEITMSGSSSPFGSCSGVFSGAGGGGSTQPGQPCTADSQCAPASGTGGGAMCNAQFIVSDAGQGSTTQVCVQTLPGKSGQGPCVATKNGSTTTTFGTSMAPPKLGYVCDELNDGLVCNGTSHLCTPLAQTGQPCQSDEDCVSADHCAFSAPSSTCQPRIALGASCPNGSGCVSTAYCDLSTMVCTALLADGSPCTSFEACASGQCVNDKCASGSSSLSVICGS